ncbi:MAG TPA: sulfatase [Deinococcales bacterium]|nr:sulfatase [Deinococcales bacterium]
MRDGLNVVFIQIDSLNRHLMGCYGNPGVRTPNLDALAGRAVRLDGHFTGSLPCMPARREIWAGSEEMWWRPWGPLEPWDRPVAHEAGKAGVTTGLVTDHYHLLEWGAHDYVYDFASYEFVRGHEFDNFRTDPPDAELLADLPDWARLMVSRRPETLQYVKNVQGVIREEDFFAPRVMTAAARWLERNRNQERFYLHVDSFDIHEPFHVPEPYRSMYTDLDYRAFDPWPRYGRVDDPEQPFTPDALAWLRAQYAGKLTMTDAWLGRVFDALDRHGLWEETAVIVTTDHGHYLGEHGRIGKPASPLWAEMTHIPCLACLPGVAAGSTGAVTQTVDHYATILELLGVPVPREEFIHSRSFAPVLQGERAAHREQAVFGYASDRQGITRDGWTLLRDQDGTAADAHWYSLTVGQLDSRSFEARTGRAHAFELTPGFFVPGVPMPQWRMPAGGARKAAPRPDLLYHDAEDPGQAVNLAETHPEKVRELEAALAGHLRAVGAPEEQFRRLRLEP